MTWAARLAELSNPNMSPCQFAKTAKTAARESFGNSGILASGENTEADIAAAFAAEERAAIIAEGDGDPLASVPHDLPPSWADTTIEPTAGACCRNCAGKIWWTEATAPKGWRCSTCHPGQHLPADRRREVRT